MRRSPTGAAHPHVRALPIKQRHSNHFLRFAGFFCFAEGLALLFAGRAGFFPAVLLLVFPPALPDSMTAWAAAKRAIGTRYGLHDT